MKNTFRQSLMIFVVVQLVVGPNVALSANASSNTSTNGYASSNGTAKDNRSRAAAKRKVQIINEGEGIEGAQLQFAFNEAAEKKAKPKSSKNKKTNDEIKDAKSQITEVHEPTAEQTQKIYENESPQQFRQKIANYLQLGPNGGELLHDAMTGGTQGQEKLKQYAASARDAQIAKGVWRFSSESALFAIANGAIQTFQLSQMYATNPVAFEQHIQSLKDPWGHFGFYAFMATNGFTEDVLRDFTLRGTQVGSARWMMYTKMIPYLGMTAGSIASQFVGDFGQLMRSCGLQTLGITTPKALKEKESRQKQGQGDPCEEAWRQWTVEKKFMQYAPSIGSMILSTAASGLLTAGFTKTVSKISTSVAAKQSESAAFKAMYLTGSKVAVYLAGGPEYLAGRGIAFKGFQWVSSKLAKATGKVAQFTLFTGLDVAMHGWVADKVGNLLRGRQWGDWIVESFSTKAEKLQETIESEKKSNWESSKALAFSEDFMDSMTAWKDFNQSHPMQSYYGWVQETANLINVERMSYHFYENMIQDLQDSKIQAKAKAEAGSVQDNVQKKLETAEVGSDENFAALMQETENAIEQNTHESVVNRLFPLYGVKPSAASKLTNADYLLHPNALEADQARTVDIMAIAFNRLLTEKKSEFTAEDLKILSPIAVGMKNKDVRHKGVALKKLQEILSSITNSSGLSGRARNYARQIYDHLGRPTPLLNYGLAYTYALNTAVAAGALDSNEAKISGYFEAANVNSFFGPYTRWNVGSDLPTNTLDYFIYSMMCGAKSSQELVNERWGSSDEFRAPRIIDGKINPDICNYYLTRFRISSLIYTDQIKDLNNGASYQGAWRLILPNLAAPIKAIINSSKDSKDVRFSKWWMDLTDAKINRQFKDYKKHYNEVAVELVKTLYRKDSALNNGVVKNGAGYTWMQQIRTLTLMLGEMYKDLSAKSKSLTNDDFVADNKSNIESIKKLKSSGDLLRFQQTYNNLDYMALKNGTKPRLLKFQYDVEQMISHYKNITSKLKVISNDDHELVERTFTEAELNAFHNQQSVVTKSLEKMIADLSKKTQLTDKQKSFVQKSVQNIQMLSQDLDTLLGYVALVDRDMNPNAVKKAAQGKCQVGNANGGSRQNAIRGGQYGDCP